MKLASEARFRFPCSAEVSVQPALVQLVLFEPHQVTDFVEQGDSDLFDELVAAGGEALQVQLKELDHCGAVIDVAEHRAPIDRSR